MAIQGSIIAVLSLLAISTSADFARNHPRDIAALVPWDKVDEYQAVVVLWKASAFCSTFIRLQDVTKTSTGPVSTATATVTVPGAPCTVVAARGTVYVLSCWSAYTAALSEFSYDITSTTPRA